MKAFAHLHVQVAEFGIEKVPGLSGLLVRKLLATLAPWTTVLFCCCVGGSPCPELARSGSCGGCMLLIGAFLCTGNLGHFWDEPLVMADNDVADFK